MASLWLGFHSPPPGCGHLHVVYPSSLRSAQFLFLLDLFFLLLLFVLIFYHLFTCAYIVWVISPLLDLLINLDQFECFANAE
jgi:hypothetical protein